MSVHNHRPYRPVCNERRLPSGQLRGACLNDDGSARLAPAAPAECNSCSCPGNRCWRGLR